MSKVRRETGEEQRVQVPHDEGTAYRIGPAPCVVGREAGGEASAGVSAGQVLSRERVMVRGADAVFEAEGETARARYRERPAGPARSETLARRQSSPHGNREVSCSAVRRRTVRIGKAGGRSR
jgi:hypothetical protein